jgi:3-hydroxyisobutyrate dehydrogenase-like beta-hydroxyacid dehydrogenase
MRVGFPLTVYDVVQSRMEPYLREGAAGASSPREVADYSTVVITSLPERSVEDVACGNEGIQKATRSGLVLVDLSTTLPELAIRVSEALRLQGIDVLDAPVSGGAVGARSCNLTIFVGGEYETYQRCLPLLLHIGRMVTYLGKSGNGQVGKRINGAMQALCQLAIYEGLALARKNNLDLRMFARAASAGCAQSWHLNELVQQTLLEGKKQFKFALDAARTGEALEMAQQLGITLRGVEAAHRVFSEHGWQLMVDFEGSAPEWTLAQVPSEGGRK